MVSIHLEIEKGIWQQFKSTTGHRNATKIIEGFMVAYAGEGDKGVDDLLLEKRLKLKLEEKQKTDCEYMELKSIWDAREAVRKTAEIKDLEEQKRIYDTLKEAEYRQMQEKIRRMG